MVIAATAISAFLSISSLKIPFSQFDISFFCQINFCPISPSPIREGLTEFVLTFLAWRCHSTPWSRGRTPRRDCRGPSRESSGSRQPGCRHWERENVIDLSLTLDTHLTDCVKKINGKALISHGLISRQRAAVETLHYIGRLLSCHNPQYRNTLWHYIIVVALSYFTKKSFWYSPSISSGSVDRGLQSKPLRMSHSPTLTDCL